MILKPIAKTIVTFVAAISLASCGSQPPEDAGSLANGRQNAASEMDFASLLKRTDHVEVCVKRTSESAAKSVGEGWMPHELLELGCKCVEESTIQALNHLRPGEHVLHNAIMQVTLNTDVTVFIMNEEKHPGNLEAFGRYLETKAVADFGFSSEDFYSTLREAGDFVNARTPEDLLKNVPACGEADRLGRKIFAGVDFDVDPYYTLRMTALRRLEFDKTLDVSGLDVALTSQYPYELCKTLSTHPQAVGKSRESNQEAERGCETFLTEMNSYASSLSPSDRVAAVRIALGYFYVQKHRSTAERSDGLYYVLEHHQKFGWSKPQLQSIARQLVRETDAKLWHDLQAVLDTGAVPQS